MGIKCRSKVTSGYVYLAGAGPEKRSEKYR
jgi:hypothetical protein